MSDLKAILQLEVPIIVEIGSRLAYAQSIISWAPGTIIELPKSADDELELLVNNKTIGTGIAVKINENFGIKVSYVGDLKSRIEALGGEPEEEPSDDELDAEALADRFLAGQ